MVNDIKKLQSATLPASLRREQLYRFCDPSLLDFTSTENLESLDNQFGQDRALEALRFGVDIKHDGYNIFLLGSTGVGKHHLLLDFLEREAGVQHQISDWCYVNNFQTPHKPRVLRLPPGMGNRLQADMARFVEDLLVSIPATFQSDEYQARLQELGENYQEREKNAFQALSEKAKSKNIALLQTPSGYTLAPMRDNEIMASADFEALEETEQKKTLAVIEELKDELKSIIRQIPLWKKESREKFKKLNREFSQLAIDQLFAELNNRYQEEPSVLDYLKSVQANVIENADAFRQSAAESSEPENMKHRVREFPEYSVNVLVSNEKLDRAPIIYEDNPTFSNLVGRVEHISQMGTLLTDFTLIKPGVLHQANGGYLVLDVVKVLSNSFAWDMLKRTLKAREIRIQSLDQLLSFASTTQLQPEPMPLDIKVVLTGDRYIYYLLEQFDPEFGQLFKVAADMSEETERSPENTRFFARLIATLQRRQQLQPLEPGAVARVIEYCARSVEDSEKLSLHLDQLSDLLCESDYRARQSGGNLTRAEHVQQAIDAAIRRLDQLREKAHESILRDIQLVDTAGSRVAQVNGLSVYLLGHYSFGRPTRITATARLGHGGVLDIEREAKLGGKIHSKGVMIISSLLASRYARNQPLPLSATLVFEQSYGGVEGDSASVAELVALLSALTGVPVNQSLAVTGSLNQLGQVQAIGGVNDKIEGFFDICRARGLSGDQGVIIPRANVVHLMLRRDVIDAVEAGQFHIYSVATVDQALELLTGYQAGTADREGNYPADSLNGLVLTRVRGLNELQKKFSMKDDDSKGDESQHGDD